MRCRRSRAGGNPGSSGRCKAVPANLIRSSSILALLAAIAVVSCGAPEEEQQTAPLLPPIGSIIGVWTINETVPPGLDPRCAPPANSYLLYVAQNGNAIIAQTGLATDANVGSNGAQFEGTLNGSTLGIQGGNPHLAGTLQTARVATVDGACGALMSGQRTMSYSEAGVSLCSGSLTFTGTRSIGSTCAGTLAATAVAESGIHNTEGTAQLITRPAQVSGTIAMGEEDWYSFDIAGVAAVPVTVLLNGPVAPANIDLFLTDNNGLALMPATSSTSGSSREAVARFLSPDTYKIRVSPPASGTASYTLLIQ